MGAELNTPIEVAAVLFDKDGTLVDFHRTWDAAVGRALRAATPDDAALVRAAHALEFDLTTGRVGPSSPFIAESNDVIAALLESLLDLSVFGQSLATSSTENAVPADGAVELLDALAQRSISCAVVTNDAEASAIAQLTSLGWLERFERVVGYDSGFGAKPAPGMVVGACALLGVQAAHVLVVGDSTHDVEAGRAAGSMTALVGAAASHPGTRAVADLAVASLAELLPMIERRR